MSLTPETIHHHLTHLPQRRSLGAALELFDALGYQYADELPLPIRNWPDGIAPRQRITRNLDDIYTTISLALEQEDITRARPEE